ncbi:MAG TPA: outer membrane beta-barrel protein [Bacteroidales bacterium]
MRTLIVSLFVVLFLLCFKMVSAQAPGRGGFQGDMPKDASVNGKIVDESTGQPVQYASVALYRAKDSTLITGSMSNADGSFDVEQMPYGRYYAVVTFLGYKKQKVGGILLIPNQKIASLGTVKINPSSNALQAVTVEGSAPPVSYQLDKKVVDIAQSVTAAGGTLADALQNAPSVQTDVQGNVTLRGSSNYTVLVDGRPSPIAGSEALQQIPANLVQSVEIITNPSAKYEAEGSAGIINVIMKKQKVRGTSGMFNGTAGTGDKYSANVNLNYKISKFNFTLGGDFTDMRFNVKSYMSNTDTLGAQYLKNQTSNGSGGFHRQGRGINAGIDYTIDDKNSLTLIGSIGKRSFSRPLTATYNDEYNNLLNPQPTEIYYLNSSTPKFERDYSSLNLDYLLKIDTKGQQLSASAYFTGGPDNNQSYLTQDTTDASWKSLGDKKIIQQSLQNSNETELRTKVDYSWPISDKAKFEAGYQGTYSNSNGEYHLENFSENQWVEDLTQRDKLNYKDQIQAGYVTYSNTLFHFDYELGIRSEFEDRTLNQEIQDKKYSVNRIDFFPSVFITRQLPWKLQIQANYTRRINRPRDWNVDPFIVHLDPQTIRQGNPGLLPEFANSYELNIQKKLNDPSFISIEGYMRQTYDLIQQISLFDPATQITTSTFANIDHDRSLGTEIMLYLEPKRWFNLNTSFNLYNYHMFGTPIPTVANNTNTWNIRVNPTLHFSKQTTLQLSYAYNAPTVTAQGKRSGFYFSTIGLRQGLFKQRGNLILQVRDLFGTTNFISTTESRYQYRYNRFQREAKVFMLTFNYRINNYRVKQNNRQNQENMNNNGNGDQQDMNQGF